MLHAGCKETTNAIHQEQDQPELFEALAVYSVTYSLNKQCVILTGVPR